MPVPLQHSINVLCYKASKDGVVSVVSVVPYIVGNRLGSEGFFLLQDVFHYQQCPYSLAFFSFSHWSCGFIKGDGLLRHIFSNVFFSQLFPKPHCADVTHKNQERYDGEIKKKGRTARRVGRCEGKKEELYSPPPSDTNK